MTGRVGSDRWPPRWFRVGVAGLVGVLVCGLAAGCGEGNAPGAAMVVCGTTLKPGPEMSFLYPLGKSRGHVIRDGDDGHVYLRLADGCAHGADLTITPAGSYRVIKTARARDGKPVAVDLQRVTSARATVTARRAGRMLGRQLVQVSPGLCPKIALSDTTIAADVHLTLHVTDPAPTSRTLDVTAVYSAVKAPVGVQIYFPLTDAVVLNQRGRGVARISPNEALAPSATDVQRLRPGHPVRYRITIRALLTCPGKSLNSLPPGRYSLIAGGAVQLASVNGTRQNTFPNRQLMSSPAPFTLR